MRFVLGILVSVLMVISARAQVVTSLTDPTYLAVSSTSGVGGGVCAAPYCISAQQGIPLNYFATSSSVTALGARIDSELASFNPAAINAQISSINSQILQTQRGLAATAAMSNIWMPSAPGKTAWAVNGAAFMSEVGGGFSVAHRLNVNIPLAVTASYGNGGSNVHVGRVGLMGEF